MTIAYRDRYGCAGARQKGVCDNKRTLSAPDVEIRILSGLRESMLQPDMVKAFIEEFHSELQRRQKEIKLRRRSADRERADLESQIERLVNAIADGSASNITAIGDKLRILEERLSKLDDSAGEDALPIEWHPNAVELYKRKIDDLQATLNRDDLVREEATVALRGLVDKIIANPGDKRGQFELELHGHLAAALNMEKHGSGGGGRVCRVSK